MFERIKAIKVINIGNLSKNLNIYLQLIIVCNKYNLN